MNNLHQTTTAITHTPCSKFTSCTNDNDNHDNYSTGSMPFPSFAKCCSNTNKEQLDIELLLDDNTEHTHNPPMKTVILSALSCYQSHDTALDENGFPFPSLINNNDNNSSSASNNNDDHHGSIDFATEFRTTSAPTTTATTTSTTRDYPSPSSSSSSSGRRLHSRKRLTPSPFREDELFRNVDNNTTDDDDGLVITNIPANTEVVLVTAIKERPNSKVGLVFSRERDLSSRSTGSSESPPPPPLPTATTSSSSNATPPKNESENVVVPTMITHVLPDSIFFSLSNNADVDVNADVDTNVDADVDVDVDGSNTANHGSNSNSNNNIASNSNDLVGATLYAVNDEPVRNPRHAAQLVYRVEREVRLTVVKKKKLGGTGTGTAGNDVVNGISSSKDAKTEIDIQLQKLKGQLAMKKQDRLDDHDDDNANDANSTANWSEANVIENAFSSSTSNTHTQEELATSASSASSTSSLEDMNSDDNDDDKSLTLIQEVPMNFTFDDTSDDSGTMENVGRTSSRIPLLHHLKAKKKKMKQQKKEKKIQKKKEKSIKERGGGNGPVVTTATTTTTQEMMMSVPQKKMSGPPILKKDAKYIRVSSGSSMTKDAKSDDEDNDDEKEDVVPVEQQKGPKKDNTIEIDEQPSQIIMSTTKKLEKDEDDDIICEEEEDEANQNKDKSNTKTKMSFKRAFGLKKSKITSLTTKNNLTTTAVVDSGDKDANRKAIDPTVSADEILNDLNSVHSSNNSKGSKQGEEEEEEEEGGSKVARVSREVNNPKSEETILFLTSAPKVGWSEGRKPPPATIPEEVPAMVTTTTTNKAEDVPENSKFTTLSMATERATSFIVESIVSNLSGGGYDSVNNEEEAVLVFPAEGSKGRDDDDEEEATVSHAEEGESKASTGVASLDDANRPVEAVLTVKTHPTLAKKKGLLNMFKKKKAKKTQGVEYVVIDQNDDAAKEETMARDDENVVNEVDNNAASKEESVVSEEDEVVIEDQAVDDDGPNEDDNARNIDLSSTQDGFFKRSMFKNKSKRSSVKTRPVLEEALPLMGDYVAVDEEDDYEEQEDICDEDNKAVVQNRDKVSVDGRDDTNDIDVNVSRGSFFKRAFKKKLAPAKKQSDPEDIVPGSEHSGDANACGKQATISDEDGVVKGRASVPGEDDPVEEDVSSAESQDEFREISLNVTLAGDVELHTESDTSFFDCALSPISSPMGQSNDKPILSAGEAGFASVGSNSDATANCPITDESTTLDNTVIVTPDARPTSGHSSTLPPTPPTPKKIEENWGMGLFEDEISPSPSASVVGPGRDDCDEMRIPMIALPGLKSFECRLQQAHTSTGTKESVNISMEVPEAEGSNQNMISEPKTAPPINRKLSFQSTYNSNGSWCKAQPQTREAVDVTTVYREGGGFSLEDENHTVDEIQSLARTKQHAFDIIKQSKSSASRARNYITPEQSGWKDVNNYSNGSKQMRISSLKKNLFPMNNTTVVGDHPIGYDEMQDGKNDTTLETVDMTGEEFMLEL